VECARKIEAAVDREFNAGFATWDIGGKHGTEEMTDAIIQQFRSL
jgi:isocitrate/isopropylmalate dehydrogenase